MRKLYCGGRFYFDYLQDGYTAQAAEDYRAKMLGDVRLLLQRSDGVRLGDDLEYLGPFYFESDGMTDTDIVRAESDMVERCTDAIFLLDEAGCPGTICELIYACTLKKRVHIFYIRKGEDEETESLLHTPCWYPVIFARDICGSADVYQCSDLSDAQRQILALTDGWRN